MTAAQVRQFTFHKRFLMARQQLDPRLYGFDLDRADFIDLLVGDFGDYTKGMLSVDEMLLHPRTALHFCDTVRQRHGCFDMPDDIILRAIMTRRKNPGE